MKKIMVVDDAAFIRKSLRMIFEQHDFEIAGEAENGLQAVTQYKRLKPDLVTMDITMPEMNGLDAVKTIKEYDPDCQILVVSAAGREETVREAIVSGAKGFIVKPFSEEKVIATANKILGL
jgi:two-component system, chemotaxis family, chemotaxis protein CheY